MLNRNIFWRALDHSVKFQSCWFKFVCCPLSLLRVDDMRADGEQCQPKNKRALNLIFEILTLMAGGLLGRGDGRSVSWRKPQTFVAVIMF